ncbi:hydrogenase maturation nickel metallochaperone HypA [Cysteiniphilum sp. JM-1]|uniref:hydrogenase maturation nickel metallochaperone HypA/HybF n=1 Tax=Cysteiniphilum sp. JM-1 TaxID=2610891 RepID=UPI0012459E87|nr:hydrogenase maturation nickel metallochaperone HypA [Cysteiniphilum sp. JM-1]
MHEFSLCQSVITIVLDKAKSMGYEAQAVRQIELCVGQLAGVDIESMRFWFPVAAKDTPLAQSTLNIMAQLAWAHCLTCTHDYQLSKFYHACPKCQSHDKEILTGQDMLVEKIEFVTSE